MSRSNAEDINLYFKEKSEIATKFSHQKILELYNCVEDVYRSDSIVFILGNGGSASIAEGFCVDLRTHPFVKEDKSVTTDVRRLKVVSLTESSGLLTGISNDIGFESAFSEQMKNFVRSESGSKNGLLICLSGSGNSANVINAIKYAEKNFIKTALIAGRGGGQAGSMVDIPIIVEGNSDFPGQTGKNNNNFHIEDFQNSISHIIVGLLKKYIESTPT